VDGRILDPERATVSALDAGFLLGDGLFESLRASDGVPYLLERHLERLYAAADELEFAAMPARAALAEQVHATLRAAGLGEAYVRVTVSRGVGGFGLEPPRGRPTVVVAALPAQPVTAPERGIEAVLLWGQRERRAAAKSTSWQHAVMARRRVERAGAQEGLYVSKDARVLEGVASNVFAVVDGRLLTPTAAECLPGITRGRLIELAGARAGMEVREAPLALATLRAAEEVFVTNAVQGLRAVCAVSGGAIGGGAPGAVFGALHALYRRDRRDAPKPVGDAREWVGDAREWVG
jgi:branched-subunit amino acid aminotransferase/4-amino-4-deoxychorismate lyase